MAARSTRRREATLARADGVVLVKNVFPQRRSNLFEHHLQILHHFAILKPDDAQTQVCEEYRSQIIPFLGEHVIMSGAVEFDNHATFGTIKVGNSRLEFLRLVQSSASARVRLLRSSRRRVREDLRL